MNQKINVTKKKVILYINNLHVRAALKQTIRNLGFEDVVVPISTLTCIQELKFNHDAMLITDWDTDPKSSAQVLSEAQSSLSASTRAILLLAHSPSIDLISIGAEYNVLRVHTGPLSVTAIREHMQAMLLFYTETKGIRELLDNISHFQNLAQFENAENLMEAYLKKDPKQPRILAELASHYLETGQWEKGEVTATSLLNAHPNNLRGKQILARCLMHRGKMTEATVVLKGAKALNPYNPFRLIDLGNALLQLGEIKEAKETFEQVLNLKRTDKEAMIGKSKCFLMDHDINEALDLLKKFTSSRERAAVFNSAAILSVRQERYEDALTLYKSGIAATINDRFCEARLIFNMGLAHYKEGNPEKAFYCFQEAAQKDGTLSQAKHNALVLASALGLEVNLEPLPIISQSPTQAPKPLEVQAPSKVPEIFKTISTPEKPISKAQAEKLLDQNAIESLDDQT